MSVSAPSTTVLPVIRQEDATSLLYREEGAIRRLMMRYVRDSNITDDLFQEVSMKVLKRWHLVREPAALRGWLFQVARNACLDHLRREERRRRRGPVPLYEVQAGGDLGRNPSERFLAEERIEAVHRALDRLPESQQTVIRLRLEEGLDHQAISKRLGISRQAVEVRLCRGRAALKEQLDDILRGDA